MLFFLRELNKALETEKDRVNQRKVNGDEISYYEALLNYDFENTDVNSCITFDDINEELIISTEIFRHGKKWTIEDINLIEEMCIEGKSILEMLVHSGRKIGPLIRKLNDIGWFFEFVDGIFKLVQYEIIDNDYKAKNTIIYYPKRLNYGFLTIKKSLFNTLIKLEFEYPFPEVNRKDLEVKVSYNDITKSIQINKDLCSYTLYSGSKDIFNSTFVIENEKLNNKFTLNLGEPKNYHINFLKHLDRIDNEKDAQ